MRPKIIALADCNAFFVSCEKVFNPALEGKPVVVLSGNDAYVVSRSPEAKAIGIKMQAMGSEVKRLVQTHGLHLFSTNPALYLNMSRRVMQTLSHFCPLVELTCIISSPKSRLVKCGALDGRRLRNCDRGALQQPLSSKRQTSTGSEKRSA